MRVLLAILLALPAFGATLTIPNHPAPSISLGTPGTSAVTITMTGTDPNATMFAASFVGPKSPFSGTQSINGFRWKAASATGSPKVTAYIYSDSAGIPGTLITNGTGVESGILSDGYNTSTWAGTLPTIVENTMYWVVLKCTSGTSVGVTFAHTNSNGQANSIGNARYSIADSSTDSAATWAGTNYASVTGFRWDFTDGTDVAYVGNTVGAIVAYTAADDLANGTQQPGFKITTPADVKLRLKSVVFFIRKSGTPGALSVKIYSGTSTTATATSLAIPADYLSTAGGREMFDFSTPVELAANTVYRIVLSAATGDGANYYYTYAILMDADAASVALSPWGMSMCTLDTTWDADDTSYQTITTLVLDSTDPFGTIVAGGSTGAGRMVVAP